VSLRNAASIAKAVININRDDGVKKDRLVNIHLFSPCPVGWRATEEDSIKLCQIVVDTKYSPLWEAEKGILRLTHEVKNPKYVQEFIKLTNRFSHISPEDLSVLQKAADSHYVLTQKLMKS